MDYQSNIFINTINTSSDVLKILKKRMDEMVEVVITEFFPLNHIILRKYNERKNEVKNTSWFWVEPHFTLSLLVDDCQNTFIKIETDPYYSSMPLLQENEISEPVLCDITELIQRFF